MIGITKNEEPETFDSPSFTSPCIIYMSAFGQRCFCASNLTFLTAWYVIEHLFVAPIMCSWQLKSSRFLVCRLAYASHLDPVLAWTPSSFTCPCLNRILFYSLHLITHPVTIFVHGQLRSSIAQRQREREVTVEP